MPWKLINAVGEGQKWSLQGSAPECAPGLGSVCCSRQMNLQALLQITPGACEAPLVFVALHRAQLSLEESALALEILRTAFATTRKQSPSELCLAVVAGAARLSPASGHSPVGPGRVQVRFLWRLREAAELSCVFSRAGSNLQSHLSASVCSSPSTLEGPAFLPAAWLAQEQPVPCPPKGWLKSAN